MEKRKLQALLTMAFLVALGTLAMLGEHTQSEELAFLQDAMRQLRRTDNLEFSYVSTIQSSGVKKSENIIVWANQLAGSWVSEHYTTDEDGTRLYLKRFCDGMHVYHYIDWSGEWELQENEETDIPYLNHMIELPYGSGDIADVQWQQKIDVQEISYSFTEDYIAGQNAMRQEALEEYYVNYKKLQNSEEELEKAALAVEQYRRTREADTHVTYRIDSAGVMRGLYCVMSLISPEVIYDADGMPILGEDYTSTYQIEIEITRYNQLGVINKIEQCSNEALYYGAE